MQKFPDLSSSSAGTAGCSREPKGLHSALLSVQLSTEVCSFPRTSKWDGTHERCPPSNRGFKRRRTMISSTLFKTKTSKA